MSFQQLPEIPEKDIEETCRALKKLPMFASAGKKPKNGKTTVPKPAKPVTVVKKPVPRLSQEAINKKQAETFRKKEKEQKADAARLAREADEQALRNPHLHYTERAWIAERLGLSVKYIPNKAMARRIIIWDGNNRANPKNRITITVSRKSR